MKAQSSIELVATVGIALILATPFVLEAQDTMVDLTTSTSDAELQSSLNQLSEAAEEVSASGAKSKRTVDFVTPRNVDQIYYQERAVILTQDRGESTNFSVSFPTRVNADIPMEQGTHSLEIEAWNNQVNITPEESN